MMFGLIGSIKATPGQRDVLTAILIKGSRNMPGCLSYEVVYDPDDEDTILITELWDNPESYRASLSLPAVQRAIVRGKPFIAEIGERFEYEPVGTPGI